MKQVILIRADLKLPPGKLGAQAAHAAIAAYEEAGWRARRHWRREGMKKVLLSVPDEQELTTHYEKARIAGLPGALITDAGKTVVAPGTVTCAGIGPAPDKEIDAITGGLKIL